MSLVMRHNEYMTTTYTTANNATITVSPSHRHGTIATKYTPAGAANGYTADYYYKAPYEYDAEVKAAAVVAAITTHAARYGDTIA
jgi:hypothetical protein